MGFIFLLGRRALFFFIFQLNKDSITLDMIKNGDVDLKLMKQYAKKYIPTNINALCRMEKYKQHIIKHFETMDL